MTFYKNTKRAYYDKGNTPWPKFLFIGFALVGTFLIWLIKFLGTPQLLTVIIPVFSIIAYCFIAIKTKLFYIKEEQIGDNAYYLGFLYTLSSLAYALFMFSASDNAPEHIISSFGVALWSTIFGVSCRVFLSQSRQDPEDIESAARARIAQAASELTTELYHSSVIFKNFSNGLKQSMQESFEHTSHELNESVKDSLNKFSDTAEKIANKIDQSFEELGLNTKKLNDASEKTVSALENMNSRIEKIEAPENMISRKVEKSFSGIENSTQKLSSIIDDQATLSVKLSDASNTLMQSIKELTNKIDDLSGQSHNIGANSQEFGNLGNKINSLISTFSEMLSELISKQSNATRTITEHANALEEQLDRSRKYTEDTHQSLALMTKDLAEKLQ